jgi:hypothetical protein
MLERCNMAARVYPYALPDAGSKPHNISTLLTRLATGQCGMTLPETEAQLGISALKPNVLAAVGLILSGFTDPLMLVCRLQYFDGAQECNTCQ